MGCGVSSPLSYAGILAGFFLFFTSCKMLYLDILNIMSNIEVKYMVCYMRKFKSKFAKMAVLETSPKFSELKPL